METIATIRAAHQNPAATVDELLAAAVGSRELAIQADEDVAALNLRRPDLLLTASDKEIARTDEAIATGGRTAEVARALAEACERRAADLREQAAEQRRRERYDAAKAQAAALPAAFERDYAELVRLGRSIVERTALARRAQAEANRDLPKDATPLPDVETFRHVPAIPKRIVAAKIVELYVAENGQILPDQHRVRERPNGMGWAGEYRDHDERGHAVKPHTVEKLYRRWRFVEYEAEAAVGFRNPGPFAAELVIPPLRGQEPDGWRLGGQIPIDAALSVLARADDPVAAPPKPASEKRTVRLERFEQEWGPIDALACNAEAPSGWKRLIAPAASPRT